MKNYLGESSEERLRSLMWLIILCHYSTNDVCLFVFKSFL